MGWQVLGRKSLANWKIATELNPSDDPSRDVELRACLAPDPWMVGILRPEDTLEPDNGGLAITERACLECFAGRGGWSAGCRKLGMPVFSPFEAFPQKKVYCPQFDLSRLDVRLLILGWIKAGLLFIIHFGITCSTWGSAGVMNGGTRRKGRPGGDGSLQREIIANGEAEYVAELCRAAYLHDCHFSIENPGNSYLFLYPPIVALMNDFNLFLIDFDQCCFGLTFPDAKKHEYCQKHTKLLTSLCALKELNVRCPGLSNQHRHIQAWGSIDRAFLAPSEPRKRATWAGAYPVRLCDQWTALIARSRTSGVRPGHT